MIYLQDILLGNNGNRLYDSLLSEMCQAPICGFCTARISIGYFHGGKLNFYNLLLALGHKNLFSKCVPVCGITRVISTIHGLVC